MHVSALRPETPDVTDLLGSASHVESAEAFRTCSSMALEALGSAHDRSSRGASSANAAENQTSRHKLGSGCRCEPANGTYLQVCSAPEAVMAAVVCTEAPCFT